MATKVVQASRNAQVLTTAEPAKVTYAVPVTTKIASTILGPAPILQYTVVAPITYNAPMTYNIPTGLPTTSTQLAPPLATLSSNTALQTETSTVVPNPSIPTVFNGINDGGNSGGGSNTGQSQMARMLPIFIGTGIVVAILAAIGALLMFRKRKSNSTNENNTYSMSNLSHNSITFPIQSPTLDFKKSSLERDSSRSVENMQPSRVFTQYAPSRAHERYIPITPTRFKKESYNTRSSFDSSSQKSLEFEMYNNANQSFITFASGVRPLTYQSFESIESIVKNQNSNTSADFPNIDHHRNSTLKSTSLLRREGMNALAMELNKAIGKRVENKAKILNQFKTAQLLKDEYDALDDLDLQCPPAPTSHVVAQRYEPRRKDECLLLPGDLIAIEKIYSDGFARAQNVSQARKRCILPLCVLTPITTGPTQIVSKNGLRLQRNSFSIDIGKMPSRTTSLQSLTKSGDLSTPYFFRNQKPEIQIKNVVVDGISLKQRTETLYTMVKKKFVKNVTEILENKSGKIVKATKRVYNDCSELIEETEFTAKEIDEMAIQF